MNSVPQSHSQRHTLFYHSKSQVAESWKAPNMNKSGIREGQQFEFVEYITILAMCTHTGRLTQVFCAFPKNRIEQNRLVSFSRPKTSFPSHCPPPQKGRQQTHTNNMPPVFPHQQEPTAARPKITPCEKSCGVASFPPWLMVLPLLTLKGHVTQVQCRMSAAALYSISIFRTSGIYSFHRLLSPVKKRCQFPLLQPILLVPNHKTCNSSNRKNCGMGLGETTWSRLSLGRLHRFLQLNDDRASRMFPYPSGNKPIPVTFQAVQV